MNGAAIAEKIRYGYAKAGQVLGLPHTLYRATSALTPALDERNRLRDLSFISSPTPGGDFAKPSKHGQPIRYALMDTRAPLDGLPSDAVQPGDYVTGDTGTFLMLSVQPDEIPMVAECSATVTIYRPQAHAKPSETVYFGRSAGTDTQIAAAFPASVVIGERTQATRADLPGDVPIKGAMILLPAMTGVLIRPMDHMIDDLGRRFTCSSVEVSGLGWRITATLSEA